MSEQQQQLVPGSVPLVYDDEEVMTNGHNGPAPPQPAHPVIEEPETDLVPAGGPSGSGDFAPGGPRIFVQAPQYHWHSVAAAGTDAEARERLVALEQRLFAFGK